MFWMPIDRKFDISRWFVPPCALVVQFVILVTQSWAGDDKRGSQTSVWWDSHLKVSEN